MFLIEYDNRERANNGQNSQDHYFDILTSKRTPKVEKKSLQIGDYLIWYNSELKIIIERKTYNDLAASLKSNHLDEQLNRMQDVKTEHNCIIILLIEGEIHKSHGHIDSKCLLAKLDHIMLKNLANIIYTKNIEHTITRIYELVDRLEVNEIPQFNEKNKILSFPKDHSDKQTKFECFCSIPQISTTTANVIKDWTLLELYDANKEKLSSITYSSGNILGDVKARKIEIAMKQKKCWIDILEKIQGITKKTAGLIFDFEPNPHLWTKENLENIKKSEKSRIGPLVAERILRIISL